MKWKGDAGAQAKIVLDVGCVVREGGTYVVALDGAYAEVMREAEVRAAAELHGEGGGCIRGGRSAGEVAVEAVSFAGEGRADCCRDEVDWYVARGTCRQR